MTLVDTNVLIDLITEDPNWETWSRRSLEAASLRGPIAINDVVYAELSVGFDAIEALDSTLVQVGVRMERSPREALFMAGKAFSRYRASGGPRAGVLADFFIGAHASVRAWPLLTRDPRRYRTYFPKLELISP